MADESNDVHTTSSLPEEEHATDNAVAKQNGDEEGTSEAVQEGVFELHIELPHEPFVASIMCSTHEQVQDIRQSITDLPFTFQYSCFHLEHQGKRINDFVELSEVPDVVKDPHAKLVEDPYTDSQARLHFVRVRELIGATGDRTDVTRGIDAGTTLHDRVTRSAPAEGTKEVDPAVTGYNLDSVGSVTPLLQSTSEASPKTVKSISISPWNPPPYHLRAKGHLMYITVTTNEGEQHNITSHVSGFFVNKSTNQKFDPFPRAAPKGASAHSLLTLLGHISPSFESTFKDFQEFNGGKDPLASFQISNAIPASPWVVSPSSVVLGEHTSDITRSQEQYLLAGPENAETLRDWNEEFQSTRELPKETVQERVFRERLTSKLFAEYNEAAVRGAVLVARGEVAPLNPTEAKDAQIFVYNNVFYSFGADGVGTFAADGGDEAARVATGKDVVGVRAVNQLDIPGLFTPGTVVVDYLGKRIVGQSIVPGIFKQRDPGENQIDYGGVEGKDVIAEHEGFVTPFAELSKAMRVKKHPVWDKEGARHDLEGSVETKGLLGTDGRKYVLDLYRITPLDVEWLDEHRRNDIDTSNGDAQDDNYPHRLAVLRPELVDSYWRTKLQDYVRAEVTKKREARRAEEEETKAVTNGEETADEKSVQANGESKSGESSQVEKKEVEQERVDVSNFSYTLNPDVCSGQKPQTEEERAELAKDEAEVRGACKYLRAEVIPRLIHELQEGDVGFPMDGASLSNLLHKRGINIRYLGVLAKECDRPDSRLQALKSISSLEMVARGFKHLASSYLRDVSVSFSHACIAHLLNCLLGASLNSQPVPEHDSSLDALYPSEKFEWRDVTPEVLRSGIARQVKRRYRHELDVAQVANGKELQLLREVSLKLGLQLVGKEYVFSPAVNGHAEEHLTNGNGTAHKKKSKSSTDSAAAASSTQTFHPDDIVNIVPLVKEASPRSALAEEALEAGRLSIAQSQKELGQELILESLSLHEQIYGILHPEVARVYYALSTLYYSLDEKTAAVELARKAVIISERTLGIDHAETLLAYLNLSLFEHATGNTPLALTYVLHALDIWKIMYGTSAHPDSITTLNNAAVMLQSQRHYPESRRWFEASLRVVESICGAKSVNTATLLFQLSQALALDRDAKAAVQRMREAWLIFRDELGPEDRNTKEAEGWLRQLTQSAVSLAKHEKQVAAGGRRIAIGNNASRAWTNGAASARANGVVGAGAGAPGVLGSTPAQAGQVQPAPAGAAGQDARSIDELLKYINGDGKKGSGSSAGKGKGKKGSGSGSVNPKRRQQQGSSA